MTYGLDPDEVDRLYRRAMAPTAVGARVLLVCMVVAGLCVLVAAALLGG